MKEISTQRLTLRPFVLEDLDDFFAYAQNPNVGPNAGWKPHENAEESAKILERFIKEEEVWALYHREDQKVVGSIGLHPTTQRAGVLGKAMGYVVAQPYWGRGLAPEAVRALLRYAFEEMGLELVECIHYDFNARSRQVIKKCGFRYEGTIRRHEMLYDGRCVDSVIYSLLREEWRAQQG